MIVMVLSGSLTIPVPPFSGGRAPVMAWAAFQLLGRTTEEFVESETALTKLWVTDRVMLLPL